MGGEEEQGKEDGDGNEGSGQAWEADEGLHIKGVAVFVSGLDYGRHFQAKHHPYQYSAHKRAMQQVNRQADSAQPGKEGVGEGFLERMREDKGEDDKLGAERGE